MELNEHLQARISRAIEGPDTLELPSGKLLKDFLEIRDLSEKDGIEYGCNLFWRNNELTRGKTVKGSKEATPLETDTVRNDSKYIGDFHVHPYTHRLHQNASIGPSITDLQEIINKPPKHHKIGVYFIFAGNILHLIIHNRNTLNSEDEAFQQGRLNKFKPDFSLRQDFLHERGVDHTHEFHTKKPSPVPENDPDYIKSLHLERDANSKIPAFHIVFSNFNLDMNRQYSARLDYDYYRAELSGESDQTATFRKEPHPILNPRTQDSPSTGLICFKCRKVHSRKRSTFIGRWHRCRNCRTIFCDWCGDALSRPVYLTRERSCDRQGCGGTTELID